MRDNAAAMRDHGIEIGAFIVFFMTLNRWRDFTRYSFIWRESTGVAEERNSKIEVIEHRCYDIYDLIRCSALWA